MTAKKTRVPRHAIHGVRPFHREFPVRVDDPKRLVEVFEIPCEDLAEHLARIHDRWGKDGGQ